jgi:2-keto-4-pentenoate hydratase/2-oxohepta-3-ene-1,7-dioic acid hydratase in catechol pathway
MTHGSVPWGARHADGRRIEVGTIFCIGRNYAGHARELNNPVPAEPVVFTKPVTSLLASGETLELPARSRDVHHEVELVAVLGRGGRSIDTADALACVAGYAVGIDVTARDLQQAAKRAAHPWTMGKGLDGFAPLGPFAPADRVSDPQALTLELDLNGRPAQRGSTAEMLFPLARLIAYLSGAFTLRPGDLIFTGTPAGVGPFDDGDRLEARLLDEAGACLSRLRLQARRGPRDS